MANFAVIENGVVTNILIAEDLASAESLTGKTCVAYTDDAPAFIGGTYDGTSFTPVTSKISADPVTPVKPTDQSPSA